jgi:hypothetical protein
MVSLTVRLPIEARPIATVERAHPSMPGTAIHDDTNRGAGRVTMSLLVKGAQGE